MGAGLINLTRDRAAAAPGRAPATARTRVATGAALAAITAVAAALRLASFAHVPPNPYYDAAVRSMGQSWHNFFYGAFEPSGRISIDKIPVDLWLQVASAKLFGFSSAAARLPEALAGIIAVVVLYDLVRRLFGRIAGLGAAASLAVLPVAVLTARSDTMDSAMMALDVAAAWLVVWGAQTRRAWPIVAAGAVMGLSFNVKLFEGLAIVPALVLLAVLAGDVPWRRRAPAMAGGLAAFAAVGGAWMTIASLRPLSARPWPIGSTDGSVWNVVFGFNGIDRLRSTASAAALKLDPPGPLRFLSTRGHDYASLVGTTLLAALVFGAIALAVAAVERPARRRLAVAGAAFFGLWLVVGVAALSGMQRFEPRYLEAVDPAIAATLGIGVGWLAARARHGGAAAFAVAGGAGIVTVAASTLLHPPGWATTAALAGAAGALTCAASARASRLTPALAGCALVAALSVPAASALHVARSHVSDAGLARPLPTSEVVSLSRFLISHQGHARYEVASSTIFRTSQLVVRDGRPALVLANVGGQPLLSPAQLARMVAGGEVRYVLLGRGTCSPRAARPCAPVLRWALAHSTDVGRTARGVPPGTLYRLSSRLARV
ncbi:MAG: glycosyltransferase family 39 protein [Solirubrobacteraceae bacterium]